MKEDEKQLPSIWHR